MYCSCAWLFVGCDVWTVDVVHMPGCFDGGDVCAVDVDVPGCW